MAFSVNRQGMSGIKYSYYNNTNTSVFLISPRTNFIDHMEPHNEYDKTVYYS